MSIKTSVQDNVGIITLKGKLMGVPDTDLLHDEIRSFLGEGIKNIVIDFNSLKWLNSLGIGAVMRCYTTVKNKDGEIKLSRLSNKTRSVFEITELINIFQLHDSINQAVNSFSQN